MNDKAKMKNRMENEPVGNDMEYKILSYTSKLQVPFILTKEDAFEKLKAKIASSIEISKKPTNFRINRFYYMSSAAALILLLFGLWHFLFHTPIKEVIAFRGQHTEYQLPDGSRVTLNADSKFTYNNGNFNKNRNLSMEGEAFFSIQKGRPFIIKTKLADIKILGTSFNVFARENSFKVSCVTGKILVASGSQSYTIIPGESALVINNILYKTTEKNIQTVANWRNGEFYFEDTLLKLIFEEIERQYNVTFVLSKTHERLKYTGGFSNKNLLNALDCVCIPMGLTYEIGRNSQIFIREKPQ